MKKKVILTGDSPTGGLHIGHYFGSIKKRIELQNECKQYIIIADYQAFFNKKKIKEINNNIINMVIEYLSLGLDPFKTTIFVQSKIPEINEFYIFFLNFVNYPRLIRNPTIKSEIKIKGIKKPNMGFITYPISQSADILSFLADLTIVGVDQKPIIEQCNEISKNVNKYFDIKFFKKCKVITGCKKSVLGIYGKNKMSKSLGNSIDLNIDENGVKNIVNKIYTDPHRIRANIPGNVKKNMVFQYLKLFSYKTKKLEEKYKYGKISDIKIKKILEEVLINFLKPIKIRREKYFKNKDYILEVIRNGNLKAKETVFKNLKKFKKIIGLN